MSIRNFAAILGLALAAAGCKSGDTGTTPTASTATPASPSATSSSGKTSSVPPGDLVGKWTSLVAGSAAPPAEFTFNKDGTFVSKNKSIAKGQPLVATVGGNYKLDGQSITLHLISMRATSTDPATQKLLDKGNAQADKQIKTSKDAVGAVEWKDKDNVLISVKPPAGTPPGTPARVLTLKRAPG